MRRLFFILTIAPFLACMPVGEALGQTKFSQLPTVLPDVNTSLIGLKNVGGTYTDYLFTLGQLATYINSGTGTVTSVGLSVPSVFTVTPSAITTNGTFSVTAAGGQPANKFYATPDGSSGALALRSIASGDLPATGTAGTYGDATHYPAITTDAQGRVSSVTTYSVSSSGSPIANWTYATYATGWSTPSGHEAVRYTKDADGRVYVQGEATHSGPVTVGTPIFTLPSGYIPTATIALPVVVFNATSFTYGLTIISIGTDGTVNYSPVADAIGFTTNWIMWLEAVNFITK